MFKIIILSIIIPVLILGIIGFNHAFAQVDSTPPSFFLHNDVTIETLDPAGSVHFFTVTVTDDTDPSPEVSCTPRSGSFFPLGTTQIDCTVTDASGNSVTKPLFFLTVVYVGDSDGDGIADNVDQCPNEPETFNGFEDGDGCPEPTGGGSGDSSSDNLPFEPVTYTTELTLDVLPTFTEDLNYKIEGYLKITDGTPLANREIFVLFTNIEQEPNFEVTSKSIKTDSRGFYSTGVGGGSEPGTHELLISFAGNLELLASEIRYNNIQVSPKSALPPSPTAPTPVEPTPIPTPVAPTPTITSQIEIPLGTGEPGCEKTYSCYSPYAVSANFGAIITWQNMDNAAHTVTSGTPEGDHDGVFNSGIMGQSETFSHIFTQVGTFDYFCMLHPWMQGQVIVSASAATPIPVPPTTPTPVPPTTPDPVPPTTPTPVPPTTPTPVPPPAPAPEPITPVTLSVNTDRTVYNQGNLVTIKTQISGASNENIALSVIDPFGSIVLTRTITTDASGSAVLPFKISRGTPSGTFQTTATVSVEGQTYQDSTEFTVKKDIAGISILSVEPTDQNGNPVTSFGKENLGFVKVKLASDSFTGSLITVNLFDSELTSLGIGSIKTSLSGESELVISFFIPDDAIIGSADIYVNIFTDWPSNGGTPLTRESSAKVSIG